MSAANLVPEDGLIAYLGPELSKPARQTIEARGYEIEELSPADDPASALPENAAALVLAVGSDHPMRASLQAEAGRRDLPCVNDLTFLAVLQEALFVPEGRRVLLTGSAGKTVTARLLGELLAQAHKASAAIDASAGFLNALAIRTEVLIFEVPPGVVRQAEPLNCLAVAVLNLTEDEGRPVGEKVREACADVLTTASFAVLGADDAGTQGLLMAVRRRSRSAATNLVPISGGATLSDGCFAIDRCVYSIRNGRTRRVASFTESPSLLGDHFGQDAAAAAAIAGHLGVNDDQVAAGLNGFRGVEGRFDCIGTEGRIVFVDDRHAECRASTEAAIAACPEVLWIGHRIGDLPKKTKAAMRGAFYLKATDGSGPPVDNVVTFKDADDATAAALRAAQDLVRREPGSTPVILFSPGAPGFDRQGELFRLKTLSFLSDRSRAHG